MRVRASAAPATEQWPRGDVREGTDRVISRVSDDVESGEARELHVGAHAAVEIADREASFDLDDDAGKGPLTRVISDAGS